MRRNASKFESNQSKSSALFESLEQRQLMSASLSQLGVLSVVGTPLNDTITVTRVNSGPFILTQVRENNVLTFSTPLLVSSISINSLAGNDTVTIGAGIGTRCFINAGDGNDSVTGGAGADVIDGGAGDDRILAMAGDDLCRGGVGDDYIDCWTGNDIAFGGAGRDFMLGYDGADRLYGEADNDVLRGEAGDDYLNGGTGYDSSFGDTGNDYLDASDGFHDFLDGGLGYDTAYIDPYDIWPSNVEFVQFDLIHYSGSSYV
jgi:Ca2+-binding RTX toxin-like protein